MTLYDISTATFTNQLDLTQGGFPPFLCWGVFWRDDGLKLYTINGSGPPRHILEWDVTTPYDLSTAVFLQQLNLSGGQFPISLRFKPDGTKMFAIDSWFSIIQWDLSTPWDVTTAVDSGGFVLNRDNENNDFDFAQDGKKLFVLGSGASLDGADDRIYELDLIDAFDIDTAFYVTGPNPSRHITENEPEGFSMKPDGTRMWVLGTVSRKGIYQYNLSPPFDIFSGGSPFTSFDTEPIESNTDAPQAPWSLRFSGNPKGSKAYFTSGWYPFGGSPNSLYELSMPFSFTTRTKPFGSVGALIKAQGAVIGNCEDEQIELWRGNRAGGNVNTDHQFIHFELRPLNAGSSTPLILGKEVTGIKVTKGQGGTSKFTLAIYSGPGLGFPFLGGGFATPLNTQLKSFTAEVDFTGTPNNGELIVPLLFPYFIDTTSHEEIQVCIAINPVVQAGHNRVNPAQSWRADDAGGLRKVITYKTFSPSNEFDYPDFPPDFLLNELDSPGDTSFFELVLKEPARQRECFDIGVRVIQKQTLTTDPDKFKMGAKLFLPKFTTGRGFGGEKMALLKGTSGISGGIPPVEPKINAFLQRTVGMGGIGNEPKINALLSTTGATVTKFTCINAHRKRLGINGTEGAGLKSSGINALLASGTAIKETFVGAKLKFPIIEQFFTSARLVGEDTKIKTFGIGAIIISDFNTNGGNGITKPVLFGVILSKPFKQFSIDSNISIPAGMTPFTNFKIDAVINGLTVEFDIDVVIEDPFQVLESESVL